MSVSPKFSTKNFFTDKISTFSTVLASIFWLLCPFGYRACFLARCPSDDLECPPWKGAAHVN